MFIIIFLMLALLTGILAFSGFVVGTALIAVQVFFVLFLLSLIASLIRHFFYGPPPR